MLPSARARGQPLQLAACATHCLLLLLACVVQPAPLMGAAVVDQQPPGAEPATPRRRAPPLTLPTPALLPHHHHQQQQQQHQQPAQQPDKDASSNEIQSNSKFARGKLPDAKLSWKLFLDNNRDDKPPSRGAELLRELGATSSPLQQQQQRSSGPSMRHYQAPENDRESDGRTTAVRSVASFGVALKDNVHIAKRSFLELRPFHRPARDNGLLPRSELFSDDLGRYYVASLGAYQLNAQLHLSVASNKTESSGRNYARGLICINSQCQQNAVLEFIQPVAKDARLFTLGLNGVLFLKPGEYVSVFIDNPSSRPLTVLAGSVVSGVLLAGS